jgi:hypothetical protein
MPHYANVATLHPLFRTAESFYDCRIADATCRPMTKAVENHIHAIRVAGIDNRNFGVSRGSTEFGSKG